MEPETIRISILDPVTLSRDCLARTLRAAGLAVVAEYADERLFLAGLSSDQPRVAVVDLSGLRDGLSVLREARQFHSGVRLVALAGPSAPELVDRVLETGASAYLDKLSVGAQSVVEAIGAVSRGERVVPSEFLGSLFQPRDQRPPLSPLRDLSSREREVLACIAGGADNMQISELLKISERTVKAHVSSLYRKLAQKNRTQLALLARQIGVRPPEGLSGGPPAPPPVA